MPAACTPLLDSFESPPSVLSWGDEAWVYSTTSTWFIASLPFSFPFPSFYCQIWCYTVWNILWLVEVSCHGLHLSSTISLLAVGSPWVLGAVPALLSHSQAITVLSVKSAALCGLLWGKLTPSQPDQSISLVFTFLTVFFPLCFSVPTDFMCAWINSIT